MSCCTSCRRGNVNACPSPSPNRKSPSPQPARNVIPKEVWQAIAQTLNAKSRASLARALPGVVPKNRRVLVRSRATAKPLKIQATGSTKLIRLNTVNPVAYKNTQWRYYIPYTKYHTFFYNTTNGEPFMINRKSGQRKPVPARSGVQGNLPMNEIARGRLGLLKVVARNSTNTWNAYMKRAGAAQRYAAGESKRANKFLNINTKVNRYTHGNKTALNNISLSDLIYWANQVNWMTPGGEPYVKIGGVWRHYAGGPVTKNQVLNNINRRASSYINN